MHGSCSVRLFNGLVSDFISEGGVGVRETDANLLDEDQSRSSGSIKVVPHPWAGPLRFRQGGH